MKSTTIVWTAAALAFTGAVTAGAAVVSALSSMNEVTSPISDIVPDPAARTVTYTVKEIGKPPKKYSLDCVVGTKTEIVEEGKVAEVIHMPKRELANYCNFIGSTSAISSPK